MQLNEFLSVPGSVVKLAKVMGIAPSLVSQWKNRTRPVPAERCPSIEKATRGCVRCEELRPDVDWSYLRSTSLATEAEAPIPKSSECGSSDPRHGERRTPEQRQQLDRRNENKAA